LRHACASCAHSSCIEFVSSLFSCSTLVEWFYSLSRAGFNPSYHQSREVGLRPTRVYCVSLHVFSLTFLWLICDINSGLHCFVCLLVYITWRSVRLPFAFLPAAVDFATSICLTACIYFFFSSL
jgi:hypothetical protein